MPDLQQIIGTDAGEIINGTEVSEYIDAYWGSDTVNGGAGDDTILADGQYAFDWMPNGDIVHGDDGNDTISTDKGVDAIFGDAGEDTFHISGTSAGSTFDGGSGDDLLVAWTQLDLRTISVIGVEHIFTYSTIQLTKDQLLSFASFGSQPGSSQAVFQLTDGGGEIDLTSNTADVYSLNLLSEIGTAVRAGASTQLISGGSGGDAIYGGDGNDRLQGGGGNDLLEGEAGDDILVGGLGQDRLSGGEGNDYFHAIWEDAEGDIMDGGDGVDSLTVNGDMSSLVISSIEVLYAGALSNFIAVRTSQLAQFQTIHALNFRFTDAGVVDLSTALEAGGQLEASVFGNTITGGQYNDKLIGSFLRDVLDGSGGDDRLDGSDGEDLLSGGLGADLLIGGAGADTMRGGSGDDTYNLDNALDVVFDSNNQGYDTVMSSVTFTVGGQHIESVILTGTANIGANGNGLANSLTGNSGNNTLSGGIGADTMAGGAGNDLYYAENLGDVVTENANEGIDSVIAQISFVLPENVEKLAFSGYQALNGAGNALDNTLTGNGNVNQLSGGDGKDTLNGQGGNDILTGGAGSDQFRFARAGASNGLDHITDFETGVDKLVLLAADYGFARGQVLTAAEFHTGGAVGAGTQLLYNNVNHILYWDADGVGGVAPIAVAVFDNAAALKATDFVFL